MRDEQIAAVTARFPPADITPEEFERYVAGVLEQASPVVQGLRVTLHERIVRPDGTYDFDATVRCTFGGMEFLTLVEAKRHRHPIKRELVQVLHGKLLSVGAQKALMVAAGPYQSGALTFAAHHGIALATVTEGRFTYHTRSAGSTAPMSREQARARFGLPDFAGHVYLLGPRPEVAKVRALSGLEPEEMAEVVFGVRPS